MTHKTKLTEVDLKRIEAMAGLRLPNDMIAVIMGISQSTFERMMKTNAALRDCMIRGRANFSGKIRNTLAQMATNPGKDQFQALKWWTQTQEGFRSVDKVEFSGRIDGPAVTIAPQIVITLPDNGRETKK